MGPAPTAARVVLVTILATGCGGSRSPEPAGRAGPDRFRSAPALEEADRAFADDSRARGVDAWTAVWAEDGRLGDAPPDSAVGATAVRRAIGPVLERFGARFRWEPTESGMLWPDSLGYTAGRYWIEGEGGGAVVDSGRYLTVWKRTGDGWRVALDLSLPGPEPGPGDTVFGPGPPPMPPTRESRWQLIAGGAAVAEAWSTAGPERGPRRDGARFWIRQPDPHGWRVFEIAPGENGRVAAPREVARVRSGGSR